MLNGKTDERGGKDETSKSKQDTSIEVTFVGVFSETTKKFMKYSTLEEQEPCTMKLKEGNHKS